MTALPLPGVDDDAALEARLRRLGLPPAVRAVRTHLNRTVMLSYGRSRVLRIHRGYAAAPDRVLGAVIRFLDPRAGALARRAAERTFLGWPVHQFAPPPPRTRRTPRPAPGDAPIVARLAAAHRELNARHFGGALGEIPIRLSGRMRRRLGELAVDLRSGRPIEILIGRRHALRHPWDEVVATLLHEMVHQWQAETGAPLDHRAGFRRKALEVGIVPRACRPVAG